MNIEDYDKEQYYYLKACRRLGQTGMNLEEACNLIDDVINEHDEMEKEMKSKTRSDELARLLAFSKDYYEKCMQKGIDF